MKKNNAKRTVVVIALIALMAIPSMFAYFTDTDNATNTFTAGNVTIDLTEKSTASEGVTAGTETEEGLKYEGVLPGEVLSKEVTVTVKEGSEDAYVLAKVEVDTFALGEETLPVIEHVAKSDWTLVEGPTAADGKMTYWYRANETKAAGATPVLFETVTVNAAIKEGTFDAEKAMNITAYAVQALGCTPEQALATAKAL